MGNFDDREIGVESNTTTISRRFVIIAFPGVNLLDVAGPSEVFSSLAEVTGGDQAAVGYTIELASHHAGFAGHDVRRGGPSR